MYVFILAGLIVFLASGQEPDYPHMIPFCPDPFLLPSWGHRTGSGFSGSLGTRTRSGDRLSPTAYILSLLKTLSQLERKFSQLCHVVPFDTTFTN